MKPGRPILPRRNPQALYAEALPKTKRSSSAMAIVLVLCFLVLISTLVIAFFSTVTTEFSASKSYAGGANAKQLADSTAQIAMAAVRQATASADLSNPTMKLAWASQPGMIRTFDDGGQPHAYYKLYSSDQMVVTTFPFNPDDTAKPEVDPNWNSKPALFTDLNAPVMSGSDANYPIVDPSAQGLVKGFAINKAPFSKNNQAPMPTKWLYVLKSGTLASAAQDVSNLNTVLVSQASKDDPIVGRIAFWTDDDTCKVNINTAAGDVWTDANPAPAAGSPGNPGSFWDTPHTDSSFEQTYLALNQPAQKEFQRYPGHPATTYLSAVFPSLTSTNIYQIVPRVAPGGSQGGTVIAPGSVVPDSDRLYASVDELLFATSRLLSSGSSRDPNPLLSGTVLKPTQFFLTAHSRAPEVNLYNQPRIVTWPLSSGTRTTGPSTDRTPYDNLIAYCGTLNGQQYYFQRSTPLDSTTDLPTTATATGLGRNRGLITYLRNLTSQNIPGFGGNFLGKYPADRDQILTEIFDYIRALNAQDTSIPTLKSFTVTTGTRLSMTGSAGMGQIVPITDDDHSDQNKTETLRGFGRFPTVREASLLFVGVGQTGTDSLGVLRNSIPPDPSQDPYDPIKNTGVAIANGMTRVQAVFLLNFFDPSQGFASCMPNYKVRVSQLDGLSWGNIPMLLPAAITLPIINKPQNYGNTYGGYKGDWAFLQAFPSVTPAKNEPASVVSGYIDLPSTSGTNHPTFHFTGANVKVEILSSAGAVLQTLTIPFPSDSFPVPQLAPLLQDDGSPAMNSDFRSLTRYTSPILTGTAPIPFQVGRFSAGFMANGINASPWSRNWLCSMDVVRSVEANTDIRLIAAMTNVPFTFFSPPQGYSDTTVMRVHNIWESLTGGGLYRINGAADAKFVTGADYLSSLVPIFRDYDLKGTAPDGLQPIVVPNGSPGKAGGFFPVGGSSPLAFGMSGGQCVPVNGIFSGTNATNAMGASVNALPYAPGDWDTGVAREADGAFINKADEGTVSGMLVGSLPYFSNQSLFQSTGGTFFSPNRQMPSAVMFGSLPTGVHANQPWQTLLFRPDPGGNPQHKGAQSPQDHLLLDLFAMPVVEPYPISDPFSTAGKVNMNYQIIPFTYLDRSTAIQAVLRAEQMLVLPNSEASKYKFQTTGKYRYFLDLKETLVGFNMRFSGSNNIKGNNVNDIFRSASEICNIWLVPAGQGKSYGSMQAYWANNLLTGDNVRERPYADIYPRLTTKSNTYTVHYRVQTLTKVKTGSQNQWTEAKDVVTAEYRGSSTFERYLDTGDTKIPDYATASNPPPLDNFYKFRVIETKQFTP